MATVCDYSDNTSVLMFMSSSRAHRSALVTRLILPLSFLMLEVIVLLRRHRPLTQKERGMGLLLTPFFEGHTVVLR